MKNSKINPSNILLGIGFLTDRPFRLNENIMIISPTLKAIALGNILAVVTHYQDHQDGWYTVDGQFHQPQPPEVIEKIKSAIAVSRNTPAAHS